MGRVLVTTRQDFTMKPLEVELPGKGQEADCKESLLTRQAPETMPPGSVAPETQQVANPTITRRRNVLALFQGYAERALADGAAPKGLEQAFAASLQISPSMWSQIKSARPIGDKLARQIEVLSGKAPGWMDEVHGAGLLTPVEKAFLELSLRAWRITNSTGRKQLRAYVAAVAESAASPGQESTSPAIAPR
jgi:hypothetical protein